MSAPDKRICLGKIVAPHGIKGLVKIFPYGEDPNLIETLDQVFTAKDTNKTISITLKNPMGKYILSSIEGCETRESAETLKGTELWIARSALPHIDNEDEFYIEDLIGLTVFDEKKQTIGTILTIQNYGAGDLLEIKPNSGEPYFVPFDDDYVRDINLNKKYLTIENAEHFIIE